MANSIFLTAALKKCSLPVGVFLLLLLTAGSCRADRLDITFVGDNGKTYLVEFEGFPVPVGTQFIVRGIDEVVLIDHDFPSGTLLNEFTDATFESMDYFTALGNPISSQAEVSLDGTYLDIFVVPDGQPFAFEGDYFYFAAGDAYASSLAGAPQHPLGPAFTLQYTFPDGFYVADAEDGTLPESWRTTFYYPETVSSPEPSAVILLSTVLLAVGFVARKRIAQGLAVRPRE